MKWPYYVSLLRIIEVFEDASGAKKSRSEAFFCGKTAFSFGAKCDSERPALGETCVAASLFSTKAV
jgi:hypothetical protein